MSATGEKRWDGLAIRVPTLAFEPFGTIITIGMRTTLRLIKRRKRMGLFDMFKKKAEPATAAAPSSISASAGAKSEAKRS